MIEGEALHLKTMASWLGKGAFIENRLLPISTLLVPKSGKPDFGAPCPAGEKLSVCGTVGISYIRRVMIVCSGSEDEHKG
jgi:hypothetical protein